jgi:hypothetical protein
MLLAAAVAALAGGQLHLAVTDTLEVSQSRPQLAEFSRKIGVGMDASKKTVFDATLSDTLPAGCKVLWPRAKTVQVKGPDGRQKAVRFESRAQGKTTRLRMTFKGLSALVSKQACCDCDGACGRACDVEVTYRTDAPGRLHDLGRISCSPDPAELKSGKPNKVRLTVDVDARPLKSAMLRITVPGTIAGARLVVGKHPADLAVYRTPDGKTCMTSSRGLTAHKYAVELTVTPSSRGKLVLKDWAQIIGESPRSLRPVPSLQGVKNSTSTHKTFARINSDATFIVN